VRTFFVVALAAVLVISFGIATGSQTLSRSSAANQTSRASQPNTFQGVWQAVEVILTGPAARKLKPLPNLTFFAATHYSRTHVSAVAPLPILADPAKATADELRATWGPFVGEAGTYETSGDRITLRPIIAKNPAAIGTSIVYSYKFEADTLLLTAVSDRSGPVRYPETIRLTRVE
jgi:hypothetical protein